MKPNRESVGYWHLRWYEGYGRYLYSQHCRSSNVRVPGSREGRLMEWCQLCSYPGFCFCAMPKVAMLRRRNYQRVATSFMRYCSWRVEDETGTWRVGCSLAARKGRRQTRHCRYRNSPA